MADMKPVAWACWFDDQDPDTDAPHVLTHEPKAYAQRRPLVYGDDVSAQLEQARREEREAFSAWQPIETAPHGLWVLLDNGGTTDIARLYSTGRWFNTRDLECSLARRWMPLPDASDYRALNEKGGA